MKTNLLYFRRWNFFTSYFKTLVLFFFSFSFLFAFISYRFYFFLSAFFLVFNSFCFRFFRYFLLLIAFDHFTVSSLFVLLPWVLRIWKSILYSLVFFTLQTFPTFGTTCFYQGFPGGGSSFLKVAGLPTEVQNTDPTHLFFLIIQCSAIIW